LWSSTSTVEMEASDNKNKDTKAKANTKAQGQKKDVSGDKTKMLPDKIKELPEWYAQTLLRAELIDYYDVSGCYILRPWSFSIWESIQAFFDAEIKKLGVQGAYFPLFVTEAALQQEENHIEGFAPEVAWVTRSGRSPLKKPIAIRPTSETIMYPAFAKWIRSHRDLPLKVNQWTNVVRWEFKRPTPFLRTREFLWQEGHTAFSNKKDADEEVHQILELYRRVYEEILAVPVIKGQKSEKEKFPGGDYTTTVEAFIPEAGRAIQGATSHSLGQNFSKMFNIQFEDDQAQKSYAWQNSWGLTTRSIGVMILTHGDQKGLVLPPRVAPYQIVIVPIYYKDKDNTALTERAVQVQKKLTALGLRVFADLRENQTPGVKYNQWEMKGVPVRLDLGPKDMESNTIGYTRRDTGAKELGISYDVLGERMTALMDEIQANLLARARANRDARLAHVSEWDKFIPALDAQNFVLAPWCNTSACEEEVKKKTAEHGEKLKEAERRKEEKKNARKTKKTDKAATPTEPVGANPEGAKSEVEPAKAADVPAATGNDEEEEFEMQTGAAKSLCIPFDKEFQKDTEGLKCFHCANPAKVFCLWGRSY